MVDMDIVYFITNANKGIGLAMAQLLSRHPNTKVIAATSDTSTDLNGLYLSFPNVHIVSLDMASDASINLVTAQLEAIEIRHVDFLISNATAGEWPEGITSALDLDTEELIRHYKLNVTGPLSLTKCLLPHLRRGNSKVVYYVSSLASKAKGSLLQVGLSPFVNSEVAMEKLARQISGDLSEEGICVLSIRPAELLRLT